MERTSAGRPVGRLHAAAAATSLAAATSAAAAATDTYWLLGAVGAARDCHGDRLLSGALAVACSSSRARSFVGGSNVLLTSLGENCVYFSSSTPQRMRVISVSIRDFAFI